MRRVAKAYSHLYSWSGRVEFGAKKTFDWIWKKPLSCKWWLYRSLSRVIIMHPSWSNSNCSELEGNKNLRLLWRRRWILKHLHQLMSHLGCLCWRLRRLRWCSGRRWGTLRRRVGSSSPELGVAPERRRPEGSPSASPVDAPAASEGEKCFRDVSDSFQLYLIWLVRTCEKWQTHTNTETHSFVIVTWRE